MAKRPVLTDIQSGFGTTDTINANNTALKDWADNVLVRDGSSPNDMQADLDLGGNKLLNVARGTLATDGVNYSQITELLAAANTGELSYNGFTVYTETASASQDTFDPGIDFTPGLNQLQVFVDGVLQPPNAYTENADGTITFNTPLTGGEEVVISVLNLTGVTEVVTELYDIAFSFEGLATAGAEIAVALPRACSVPEGGGVSVATAEVAATAETTFTIEKNGSSIGTVVFAASGTTGTFTLTGTDFVRGDRLSVTAPDPADSTLASICITVALNIN